MDQPIPSGLLFGDYGLILSHFFAIPSVVLAFKRKLYPEATLIVAVVYVSLVYHACQTNWICQPFTFHVLQRCDHLMVYSLLTWLVLFFAETDLKYRFPVFIAIDAVMLPFIIEYSDTWWVILIVIALDILGFLFCAVFLASRSLSCNWKELIILVILVAVGLFFQLWGGSPGTLRYAWTHTLWHVLIFSSLYVFLRLKERRWWGARIKDFIYNPDEPFALVQQPHRLPT